MSPVQRTGAPAGVSAVLPIKSCIGGFSGSFLIAADDGRRYWCKALNNRQSPRVPITEQIVARLGRLVGAPVCEPQLVLLDGVAGFEFVSGRMVEPGWAHGSLALDPALEIRWLENRSDDENRRRHAGIFALHDWLAGSDPQWLYATAEDNAYYSHDHGFYLTGPNWTDLSLEQNADTEFALPMDQGGLEADELRRLADRLENLSKASIEAEIALLPGNWPVGEGELQAVADFADHRKLPVATRLRRLVP
jgi:hypothetical protein